MYTVEIKEICQFILNSEIIKCFIQWMALFFVTYSCEMMKTYRRILIFLILHVFKNTRSQYLDNVDVISAINLQPTPISEPGRETDVATVLLVDNNDRASHGRFLNVKPSVGLITSTARTFIQEGITTEYATQLVGTTLNNGRLYAQLLSKSTRVLYDNNDNRKSAYINEVLPQHNNWRLDDDLLLQSTMSFIKNTDDYGQSNPAFLVYPSQSIFNKIPVYQGYTNSEEASLNTRNNINEHDKILQGAPVAQIAKVNKIINPDKVEAKNTLPTFTVTNEFAPSGISYNGQRNKYIKYNNSSGGLKQVSLEKLSRSGKNVIQPENSIIYIQHLPEVKNLTSITYYGFADFTTVVGDTVIIFSPSTINSFQNTHITSIIGEATLNDHEMITATTFNNIEIKPTSINFSNEDINNRIKTETHEIYNVQSNFILEGEHDDTDYDMITIEVPETTTIEQQQEIDTQSEAASTQGVEVGKEMEEGNVEYDENGAETETVEGHSNDIIKEKPSQEAIATTPFMSLEMEEKNVEEVPEQINAPDTMIEPSEKQTLSTPMLSTPSNDDISKIFASLASAKVQQELENRHMSETSQEIEPKPHETQVLGGVTTIFFEDDPFSQFEQPNQMESNTTRQEKQQDYEPKNTTEHTSDETTIELETETTIGDDETTTITEKYIEEDSTILTTTDSITDPISTARNQQEIVKPCEGPLKLIPSTVYKTLTFLTTYFIPVEDSNGIESVSTSVKTDRMETSDISYNLPTDCYYDMINPTNIQLLGDQVVTALNNQTSKQLVYSEDNQTTTTTPANGMMMSMETSTSSLPENKETTNVEVSRDDEDVEETTTEIAPTTTEKN